MPTDLNGDDADRAADDALTEMRAGSLLVVGAGEAGRWIASVLDVSETAFADRDPDAARRAAAGGGRAVALDSTERFDLVAIAVPISAAERAIATHAPIGLRGVLDVTGTMRAPLAAMRTHAPDAEHVSLHPLFAPERGPGRVAIVTGDGSSGHAEPDDDEEDDESRTRARDSIAVGVDAALRAAGNEPFVTTAAEHDRAMETVQARAHAAVLAFSLASEPIDERFHTPVSEALSAVVARVTDGSPRTYAEIQATFPGSEDVARAAIALADADPEAFERLYREAGPGDRE